MDGAKRALRRRSETVDDSASTGAEDRPWATAVNGMGGCWKNAWPKFACEKPPMADSDNKTTEEEEEEAGWEESAASLIISGKTQKMKTLPIGMALINKVFV